MIERVRVSLRWYLPTSLLLLGGAGLVVGHRLDLEDHRRAALEAGRESARLVAYRTVAGVERHLRAGEPADARDVVDAARIERSVEFAALVDGRGTVTFATDYAAEGKAIAGTPFARFAPLVTEAIARRHEAVETLDDADLLVLATPTVLHTGFGRPAAAERGALLVGFDLSTRLAAARAEAGRRSWRLGGLIAALVTSLWLLLSRLVTRRAARLEASTRRIADGDFTAQGALRGADELARLSRSIDRMAAALGEKTAALSASERRFRQLIEHGTDVLLVVDGDGRMSYVSPSAERVLGHRPESLLGRRVEALVDDDSKPALARALTAALADEAPDAREEIAVRTAAGERRLIELFGYAPPDLRARGEAVLNARDLTSWRDLEDQLRQAQKMEAIGRLAGGVAHDFNNYLTAILGYGELLAANLAPESPAARQLGEIRNAARRAADLTGKLLAFGRRQMLQPVDLDLNQVLRGLESLLRRLLGETMSLEMALAPRPVWVRADRSQLEQVVLNLATNARDAMERGGRLTISTTSLPAEGRGAAGAAPLAALRVRDDGSGMSAEVQRRIFDPFFTTKEVGRGTGLGLSTVLGIVEQSGGRVRVESAEGAGTLFEIVLPAIVPRDAPPAESLTPAGPVEVGVETILVAEDEAAIRRMLSLTLTGQGYRVLSADSPRAALELVRAEAKPIDLLLTDIVMPELSGPELAAELRRGGHDLRVLYISGYSEEVARRENALEPGARLLAKPFTTAALLAAVRAALDGDGG
ncbi:MAG: response regulator [Thermoanaerobaculia bacterium]|nr:response regulator [Thermoanaerobaculia bacterium]